MMLSAGERLVIIASLQWAAMEHEKEAKHFAQRGNAKEAARKAAFSGECARLADILQKAG